MKIAPSFLVLGGAAIACNVVFAVIAVAVSSAFFEPKRSPPPPPPSPKPDGPIRLPVIAANGDKLKIVDMEKVTVTELANRIKNVTQRTHALQIISKTKGAIAVIRKAVNQVPLTSEDATLYRSYYSELARHGMEHAALKRANFYDIQDFVDNLDLYYFWYIVRKCCFIMVGDQATQTYSLTCMNFLMQGAVTLVRGPEQLLSSAMNASAPIVTGAGSASGTVMNTLSDFIGLHSGTTDHDNWDAIALSGTSYGADGPANATTTYPDFPAAGASFSTIEDLVWLFYEALGKPKIYKDRMGVPQPHNVVDMRPLYAVDPQHLQMIEEVVRYCYSGGFVAFWPVRAAVAVALNENNITEPFEDFTTSYIKAMEQVGNNPYNYAYMVMIDAYLYIVEDGVDADGRQLYSYSKTPPPSPLTFAVKLDSLGTKTKSITINGRGFTEVATETDTALVWLGWVISCCWAYMFREAQFYRSVKTIMLLNTGMADIGASIPFYNMGNVEYPGYALHKTPLYDPTTGQVASTTFTSDVIPFLYMFAATAYQTYTFDWAVELVGKTVAFPKAFTDGFVDWLDRLENVWG